MMAKHRSDPRTTELLAQIEDTRTVLRSVVDELGRHNVRRNEIAALAHWNPGYLSEVLNDSSKIPTVSKTEDLIRALVMFIREKGAAPEATHALRRLATRYDIAFEPLAHPASGPLASIANNYVRCVDVEQALAQRIGYPGFYAIDGTAMSGVSTALSHVGHLLQERGIRVARIDAKTDLSSERLGRSKARILGALAAAVVANTDLLDEEYHVVQDALKDHLEAAHLDSASPGFGVLVDNVNHLPEDQQLALGRLFREWQTRRAALEPAFTSTTVWLGYTWRFESIKDVAAHSHMALDYMFLRPFENTEIVGLAKSLEPFGRASGRIRDKGWAEAAARAARRYFNGQPHLTHLYLWDRMEDGETAIEQVLSPESRPTGAYEGHLKQLARTAVGLIPPGTAEDLAHRLRDERKVGDSVRRPLEDVGVVGVDGLCTSRYYTAHLPGALESARSARG